MKQNNLMILFLNIFFVLFLTGTSSIHQLQLNLIEIERTLNNNITNIPLVPEMLKLILSPFVVGKFIFGYLNFAAHIIAFYPILNYDLYDLLIPTIVAQSFYNILLNLVELLFGYFTCRCYLIKSKTACKLFYLKMISKIFLGMMILNVYWNFYAYMRYPVVKEIPTREFLKQIPRSVSTSRY